MKLEGIHHITAITGDAQRNVDFYAGILGLRMVKKTVNQDQPDVYHLFYADEEGSPGADLTFFEFRGAPQGRAGAGMVHRIVWRVASTRPSTSGPSASAPPGIEAEREGERLRFADPEGLEHELAVVETADAPLDRRPPRGPGASSRCRASTPRAPTRPTPKRSGGLLADALGFEPGAHGWEARGIRPRRPWVYDAAPAEPGIQGAGTVHHIAWASQMDEHEAWRERAIEGGARPTPVIDRFWFRSIYFREPSGVLFEIATLGPGFGVDEDPEHLGEKLILPPFLEDRREEIEAALVPVTNPRVERAAASG